MFAKAIVLLENVETPVTIIDYGFNDQTVKQWIKEAAGINTVKEILYFEAIKEGYEHDNQQ